MGFQPEKNLITCSFFGERRCQYSQAFTPQLIDFYHEVAKPNNMEIIYVSSDNTQTEFHDYYQTMPWLAMAGDTTSAARLKHNLATKLSVFKLPSLIVLYHSVRPREAYAACSSIHWPNRSVSLRRLLEDVLLLCSVCCILTRFIRRLAVASTEIHPSFLRTVGEFSIVRNVDRKQTTLYLLLAMVRRRVPTARY